MDRLIGLSYSTSCVISFKIEELQPTRHIYITRFFFLFVLRCPIPNINLRIFGIGNNVIVYSNTHASGADFCVKI